ncbi:MAG: hypothetical protein AB3N11_13225 [Arenibacterium sp.]
MARRNGLTVFKDILLALLNATLILIALCLWLAWQLGDTISAATTEFSERVANVKPLRGDVQSMTAQVAALREDVAALRQSSDAPQKVAVNDLLDRLDQIDIRVSGTLDRVDHLVSHPGDLVEIAVERAGARIQSMVHQAWACVKRDTRRPARPD